MTRIELLARVERAYWRRLFRVHAGKIRHITAEAGCCKATVYKRLQALGLDVLKPYKYSGPPLTLAGAEPFLRARAPSRARDADAKRESDP